MSSAPALRVHNLNVGLRRRNGHDVPLVQGVDLDLAPREVMGIVGETGAGKTLTMRALLGLLPPEMKATGELLIAENIRLDLSMPEAMRRIRGRAISIVLQNPVGMFDPLVRIKDQLVEGVLLWRLLTRVEALARARELLTTMGFADPMAVLELFPHQMSGGMSQRAAIAMALMPHPRVIIADEPTSALDAHLRADALDLLRRVATEQQAAVLLVSHDLGLVSRFCDSITVMYAGRVVEQGSTATVLGHPRHPYTAALLECSPSLDAEPRSRLRVIGGTQPLPGAWPPACVFAPRCPLAFARCRQERPVLHSRGRHAARCHLAFREGP